ncbi:unnamed protein product [Rotaria sordida]|uniref:Homeobox protein cut-like n=1 Tax=Rotaria sordida TaxID=392033 RepID=A0A818QPY7_9BILA|nr:unnamed protein product [Rotaria sordida]CAF3641974.1 unnamed protein product [Rotaria sordida]
MTTTNKNIESIVKQWTSFDLKSIQHDLDVTTTEIVSCADESDQSRRKLVELSRDFKKNTNEDVRKAITPILKSFQIEIDSLSKRSKVTKQTFLEIYQYLSELPDPVPILEYIQTLQKRLENVFDLEIQNQNLREILDELAHVKSQKLTIKQLRDKIKDLEEKTEVIIQQHIKEKEDFQRIFADKGHQFDLITKYAQMEMHQSVLDPLHQDMFEYKIKQDDTNNICSSDSHICNQDLEQMNKRTSSNTERFADILREDCEQKRSANNKSNDELISQEGIERKLCEKLELELATKERQIVTLADETQKLQSTLIKIKETSFTQVSDLESVLREKEKLIAQLENKLQSQADYNEIKRELTLLKSIEFSTTNRSSNDDQTGNLSKKSFDIQDEQTQIKMPQMNSESNTNHHQLQHSCRHCTSPCLHRSNAPYLPIPSFLSSSASSSSNSSSSPSSPSQIYLKPHQQSTTNCNGIDDMTRTLNETSKRIIPSIPTSLSIITTKDNLQLSNTLSNSTNTKYPSLTTSCSTMVTPTASLLSSVTTTTLTPSNLFPGHQLSSVQCTKLHCPPTSSWSPPLSSSSGVSSIATTSTDNRTVIKSSSSKQTSPKPSPSPTILVPPSTCTPVTPIANANILEPLDTTYVANVVRKLLAQHNIGQRIFARYILSLSQGTVSELLSKPKCWSKLTEKGKESYRKMWCWANSEESILTLKSISPRKGMNNRSKDNPYPAISTKRTDPATHQKIVQILADAQKQQIAAAVAAAAAAAATNIDQKLSLSPCSSLHKEISNVNLSTDPLESKTSSSSSSSSITSSSTVNSPLNESLPSDQQTFLLPVPPPPLPSSTTTTSTSNAAASLSMLSAFVPSLLMRTANSFNNDTSSTSSSSITATTTATNNLLDCSASSPFNLLRHQPDNYRNWLMLQEIVRNNDLFKQFQPTLPPSIDIDDESEQDNDDDSDNNDENDDDDDDDDDNIDDENPISSDEIPLDLSMKIDSNQHDIEQTSIKISNNKQQLSTKHVKTALTPLREQDTSKYRYINTMELVQTVKDILSRYSISQRHFGEKILGLSQGSVSDILARPKQWELLTQKGREPFLRMRIFLDDPNAIKQLVQTVTTTPTSTSTTTNSILLPTFCPPPPSSTTITTTSSSSSSSLLSNTTLNGYHSNKLLTRDNSIDSQSNILLNDTSQLLINETIQLPSSSSSPSNGIITNSNKSKSRSKNSKINNDKSSIPSSSSSSNHSRHSSTNPLMTPYELPKISLPNTIDTEQLSSQVRELLFAYSIGQRVFGEAVLNLSQGTVSEILSKPRPWPSLSVKGREPYIRMYTWYHDTGNVQKLLAWKRERDALRRSRPPATTTDNNNNGDLESGNNNSTIKKSLLSSSSTTTNNNNNNNPKRRYLFTDDQRRVLKQIFENEPYPSQSTLEQLVGELSLPMNKIANWFHNSRMRAKTNIRSSSSPTNKISTSSLNNNNNNEDLINTHSDDEDDLDDNNNNNNNNNGDDDDDDDDYPILPTIVPLTSSWLNGTNDSNSSTSPIGLSATSTNIVSLIDDQKITPISSSSSSKKRKSVPQKIVTTNNNNLSKKFHNDPTIIENDSNDETNQKTNLIDILT